MGRRVRRLLIIIPAAAVLLFSVLFTTCSNEFDIFNAIKTEMKIANDLFLKVVSIAPAKNSDDVNPGLDITIEFDRTLNVSALSPANIDDKIKIIPPVALSPNFNSATKTLTLTPLPFLEDSTEYQVWITKDLRGDDGSELQEEVIWTFTTGIWPAGNIAIDGDNSSLTGDVLTGDEYVTHDGSVTLRISFNSPVDLMKYSIDSADMDLDINWLPANTTVGPYTLEPSGDGKRTVYIRFKDNDTGNRSETKSDSIIRDTNSPYFSPALADILVNQGTAFPVIVNATVNDATSGVDTDEFSWSKPAAVKMDDIQIVHADKGFTSVSTQTAITSVSTDGVYTLTLDAEDLAGLPVSDSLTLTVDRVPPGTPTWNEAGTTDSPVVNVSSITWDWNTGGGGSGNYQRRLDGGIWYNTSSSVYTATWKTVTAAYGPHTLSVRERDIAGNWSSEANRTIYVSPDVVPRWGQVNVSTSTDLDWPTVSGIGIKYDVYFWESGSRPPSSPVATVTTSELTNPGTLDSLTNYSWYYVAYHMFGKIKVVDYTSPTFTFTTRFVLKL
jgi:hypothetical protein